MRILKRILLFVVGLFVLVLIVALFVSKDMNVNKEVVINKPKQQVFDFIKLLKNQNDYAVWYKIDPNMKHDFKGTDGTIGATNSWDGNDKVGKGEQEIKAIKDGERIDFELRFEKPFKAINQAYLTTDAVNDSTTKVKWGFVGKMNYPLNIMKLFISTDKMIGNDYQQGLDNLKKILEK